MVHNNCFMDKVFCGLNCLCDGVCYVLHNHLPAFLIVTALAIGYCWYKRSKKQQLREKWNSVGKDVVVLHGLVRTKVSPNLSPFVLKLETYLRMSNIKYEFDSAQSSGPKGKTPWITLNGQSYADSELIIEMLNKKFTKDLNSHLSMEEKAIARFMKIMIDEHMFWAIEHWITVDPNRSVLSIMGFPSYYKLVYPAFQCKLAKKVKIQGLGVHSNLEVEEIMRKNFEALSIYLGNKPFMMGSKPSEVDSSAFGFLAHFLLAQPGSPYQAMMTKSYPNLHQYFKNMKETFYKDWNNLLAK